MSNYVYLFSSMHVRKLFEIPNAFPKPSTKGIRIYCKPTANIPY